MNMQHAPAAPKPRHHVYDLVFTLLEQHGGKATYLRLGRGGAWELTLAGRTIRVPVPDSRVNVLDRLYVPKVTNPRTWDDYDKGAPLVPDAFWRLVELFQVAS